VTAGRGSPSAPTHVLTCIFMFTILQRMESFGEQS
jgi:hypothetical protein